MIVYRNPLKTHDIFLSAEKLDKSVRDCHMKNTMIFSLLLITAVSCDAPQRTRMGANGVASNSLNTPNTQVPTGGSGVTPTPSTPTTTPAAGFTNCPMTYAYATADLGNVAICQSTIDETTFQFKSSTTDTSSRTCLIPTYKDSSGASTYIGNPQCTLTEAGKLYTGKLLKNRSGFESASLNGVMLMKETLLVEYFGCMDSYMSYMASCGNSQYCANNANARRTLVCNAFKAKYPNNYLDIRTR